MLQRVLTYLYTTCGFLGITRMFYALSRRNAPLIVTYHNVIPDELFDDALHLGVSHRLSEFKAQLAVIASRFDLGTAIPPKKRGQCAITFDDGYCNNLLAARHLESIGARGVFFIPVEPVLTGGTLVIDQVLRWFSYAPSADYTFGPKGDQLGLTPIEIRDGRRAQAYSAFYSWMLENADQWKLVPELLNEAFPFSNLPRLDERYEDLRFRPMTADELAGLSCPRMSLVQSPAACISFRRAVIRGL
jgi:hypothetical protein